MMAFWKENIRLLYWLFFKPFTLRRWLMEIAPGVDPGASGISMWRASRENPELRRYLLHCVVQILILMPICSSAVVTTCVGVGVVTPQDGRTALMLGVALGIALGAVGGVAVGVSIGTSVAMVGGAAFAGLTGIGARVADTIGPGAAENAALALGVGLTAGASTGTAIVVALGIPKPITRSLAENVQMGFGYGFAAMVRYDFGGAAVGGSVVALASSVFETRALLWPLHQVWLTLLRLSHSLGFMAPHRVLALSPHNFDELIYIPLIGLRGLLVEAGREDPDFARQHIHSLQTCPGLKGIAQSALAEIQAYQLTLPSDLSGLARAADVLPRDYSLLPESIRDIPHTFHEVSDLLRGAFITQGGWRRLEMIDQAIQKVVGLGDALVLSDAKLARTYLPAVEHWQKVLKAEIERMRVEMEESQELLSPFYAGLALAKQEVHLLVGRGTDLRWLEDQLTSSQPSTIFLSGPGRIGKSSLLQCLPVLLGPSTVAVWIDCQGVAACDTKLGVYQLITAEILKQSTSLGIDTPAAHPSSDDPYLQFKAALEQVHQRLGNRRLLLSFDEIPEIDGLISRKVLDESFLAGLRNLAQKERWITLLFAGRRSLEDMPESWAAHFNHVAQHQLHPIDEKSALSLLSTAAGQPARFPVQFDEDALTRLLQVTAGQPFLLQAVGQCLVEHLNQVNRRQVISSDVELILARVLTKYSTVFRDWARDYGGRAERALLDPLVSGPALSEEELLARATTAAGEARTTRNALRRLRQQDILIERGGLLSFRYELLRRYWEEEVVG